jgi:hypothetical protein
LREILRVKRLGKNVGGYFGEIIDIRSLLGDIKAVAQANGWTLEAFHKIGGLELLALHRNPLSISNSQPPTRTYISTGIHGDEPAGPLAVLRLLRENRWPQNLELWICPCLNPTGFVLNTRENDARKDLNRDYRHFETGEVTAHVRWLQRQPNFDVTLCLHRPSLAEKMVKGIASVCPIDLSPVIEGREAHGGIITPNLDPASRPQWPEAFWLIQNKTRQSCTLEAPSDFPLTTRVDALVAGVNAVFA